ncbi:hypothetical protein QQ045_023111 [Rhodiola kirilowii]
MSYYNQGQPPIDVPPSQGYPQAYTQQYAPQQYQQPPPHQQKSGPGFLEGWKSILGFLDDQSRLLIII